jgi:hypothetical protein
VILFSSLASHAQKLNIDLGAALGTPSDAYGAVSGQTGRWNTVGLGVTSGLVDTTAAPTAVNITVSADADTGQQSGCPTADADACVADAIYTANGTWTVNLAGLANGTYEVFLYAPRHSLMATGNILVSGIAIASIAGTSDCDLTEGAGSVWVRVTVLDGTLSLTGNSAGSGSNYAGLAALQLTRLTRLASRGWNVDLGDSAGTPSDAYGAASGQTGRWNTVNLGVTSGLVDTATSPTAVSITVSADTDGGNGPGCFTTDTDACVGDNIFTHNGTWTVNLAGLANDMYEVFLYAPTHVEVATGNMLVNGIAAASIAGTTDCDLTEGVGSVWVRVTVIDGTLSLTGDSAGSGFSYAGLAALQLMAPDVVFNDGFESGDTSIWTQTVP